MTTLAPRTAVRATAAATSAGVRASGHLLVLWCLGFAAVNGGQLISGGPPARPSWLLAAGLWGAAGLLVLYSLGNVLITVGTVSGVIEPTRAWEAAGGVTGRAVGYLLFLLVAAPLFTAVAVSYQRRLRPHWSAAAVGVLGAPVLLGALLVMLPAVLSTFGLLP